MPGGWCDVLESVKSNTIKEVKEETGLDVEAIKIIAVQDRNKHNKPIYAYGVCKVFILCNVIGGKFEKNIETTEIKYFSLDDIPNNLAEEKTNKDVLSNTLFLSKKDGKYGFVNSKNEVIVDYIYDDATEQNEYGYAAVKKDGKWGSIDINGKVVIEPTYNLDNNIIINFIGKWHLGQDANMNYYCEI